jgi:excinuclease ABC subunit C
MEINQSFTVNPLTAVTHSSLTGRECIAHYVTQLPNKAGIYKMIGANKQVLYVGKAKYLAKRVQYYTHYESLPFRLQQMVSKTIVMEFIITQSEVEALLLEANLIKALKPKYNILLKDDKSYPFMVIDTNHPYPAIYKTREEKQPKRRYFGPFVQSDDIYKTIEQLQKIFRIRNCSERYFLSRKRPCLQYQLQRCSAPCVGLISQEDYSETIQQVITVLEGKSSILHDQLVALMNEASEKEQFEKAAYYRDRIRSLSRLHSQQTIVSEQIENADIIALCRHNDQVAIQQFFFRTYRHFGNNNYLPSHVEDVDDAHIMYHFLLWFYSQQPPPPLLLLNVLPIESHLLEEALRHIHKQPNLRLTMQIPKQGEKAHILKSAYENAEHSLLLKRSKHEEQARLLEKLAALIKGQNHIHRIEVYDNSHLMGTASVGVMIVATQSGWLKRAYRRFHLSPSRKKEAVIQGGDDYAMMDEMLTRRFERLKKENPHYQPLIWPDLIVLDGGIGQLNIAKNLKKSDIIPSSIPCIAIAKTIHRNAGKEVIHTEEGEAISLDPHDSLLHYLQHIRDEAHRFAITTHRQKRKRQFFASPLQEIAGIGPSRQKRLLEYFGSLEHIARASIVDLMRVEGIHEYLAEQIYAHFHR